MRVLNGQLRTNHRHERLGAQLQSYRACRYRYSNTSLSKGAIPLWEKEVPAGYGQHWEALHTIQASYGDVMTHEEFFELVDRS